MDKVGKSCVLCRYRADTITTQYDNNKHEHDQLRKLQTRTRTRTRPATLVYEHDTNSLTTRTTSGQHDTITTCIEK